MSALVQQHERWAEARTRLWGLPEAKEARQAVWVQPINPPEPTGPVALPRPTQAELDALFEDTDDRTWNEGFVFILKSFGENMRRLTSLQRDQHIVDCRIAIATYLRQRGWSYPRIGQVMHRDHSSIIHLLEPQRKRNAYLKRQAANVKKQRARRRRVKLVNEQLTGPVDTGVSSNSERVPV